jgi:hypothetical protein
VLEQRYRVVMAVLGGAGVSEVAAEAGGSPVGVYVAGLNREGGLAELHPITLPPCQ